MVDLSKNRGAKHWNLERGYDFSAGTNQEDVYPLRAFSSGQLSNFMVILRVVKQNVDDLCAGSTHGFKVTFHTPYEVPHFSKQFFHVAPNQYIDFSVTPLMTFTSKKLDSYSPQERKCFLTFERNLTYFKYYTLQNCIYECLSTITLRECGCVRFAMPSKCVCFRR